jgi:hypothetical protein
MSLIYKGVKGLVAKIITNFPFIGADDAYIKLYKPESATVQRVDPSSVDEAQGFLYITTTETTFDEVGEYKIQAHIVVDVNKELDGDIAVLKVAEPLSV